MFFLVENTLYCIHIFLCWRVNGSKEVGVAAAKNEEPLRSGCREEIGMQMTGTRHRELC